MYLIRCSTSESRIEAYQVLVELANNCPENMQEICLELTSMHHHSNTSADNQWEVSIYHDLKQPCFYFSHMHLINLQSRF